MVKRMIMLMPMLNMVIVKTATKSKPAFLPKPHTSKYAFNILV